MYDNLTKAREMAGLSRAVFPGEFLDHCLEELLKEKKNPYSTWDLKKLNTAIKLMKAEIHPGRLREKKRNLSRQV
jgi:hypothetical protein